MALVLVGINHNTANIALREKVAFPPEIVVDALRQVHALEPVNEAVIVSTCNRTEIYLAFDGDADVLEPGSDLAANRLLLDRQQLILAWLADYHEMSAEELGASSYAFGGEDVVRHLMKVSCGLDSMVLGEPQILGQIKSAFAVSKDLKVLGSALGRAF